MNNILITAGTTSLAFKVKNLIANDFNVSLGTAEEIPSIFEKNYIKLPKESSNSFINETLKTSLDNSINYLLPLTISEALILSQNISLFEEYGITILIPPFNVLNSIITTNLPDKEMNLSLLNNGYDFIKQKQTPLTISGLGILSDSEIDFILVIL